MSTMCTNKESPLTSGHSSEGKEVQDKMKSLVDSIPQGNRKGKERTLKNKETRERRAVHIAAVIMNAAGLCRYDTVDKCRHSYPNDATCEKCIERWLLAKAEKELRNA